MSGRSKTALSQPLSESNSLYRGRSHNDRSRTGFRPCSNRARGRRRALGREAEGTALRSLLKARGKSRCVARIEMILALSE